MIISSIGAFQKGVSIVICCYNSAYRLLPTLQHIVLQEVITDMVWEVIIVDNASTDNTKDTAYQIWNNFGINIPFKVVYEPTPGLSFAREKGFETAQYEYILLCDDDNWLAKDYVQNAYQIMDSNGNIGALNGRSEAVFEAEPPVWFNSLRIAYAVGNQYNYDKKGEVEVVWGAGMILRKSAWFKLTKAGFKSLLSDRKGNKLSSGGDDELCAVLKMIGYKIWYDPRLYLKHFMAKDRLSERYIRKLFRATAFSVLALEPYKYYFSIQNKRITRLKKRIWYEKAYLLLKEIGTEIIYLKPVKAWLQKDLKYNLRFKKKILICLIYLTSTDVLDRNLQKVFLLSKRLADDYAYNNSKNY